MCDRFRILPSKATFTHNPGPAPFCSRRHFLGSAGAVLALGTLATLTPPAFGADAALPTGRIADEPIPPGKPLRLKPVLTYHLDERRELTSWRSYGGLRRQIDVDLELRRIAEDLKVMVAEADFPITLLPIASVNSNETAQTAANTDTDAFIVFGASGAQQWIEGIAGTKKPTLLFVRHKSGPVYLYYEIAHWRLLRKSEDTKAEPNLDFDDVVVDDFKEVTLRLRALYGLHNARGTTMLALGGLSAYSKPGQELGPGVAQSAWGYTIKTVTHEDLAERVKKLRADPAAVEAAERAAGRLIGQSNIRLDTQTRFVVNSYLTLQVIRDLMTEHGATNVGVADCMTGLIPIFDTPPCLVLSLLNDAGFTAFCHTDLTHTLPGVLMRWISGKPSFVCNSHFPHHRQVTLAHCAAPRKMNGRDNEPTTLMTHYESDYGAATKVHYPKDQVLTCIVPNLRCTKWFAFRAKILDSPAFDMCRSQMDIEIDGDWKALTRELEGFHTIVTYGDYLREAAYAASKIPGLEWKNYSPIT
jgi:hypothetical protein